jgi:hypothetical protein
MKIFQFIIFSEYKNDDYKWLNIGYLISSLEKHPEIELHTNFFLFDEIDAAIAICKTNNADIIGLPLLQANYNPTFDFVSKVKEHLPNAHITVGNLFASTYPKYCMDKAPNIDTVVCGEGEQSLFTLCDAIVNKRDLSECKGIYHRKNNEIIKCEKSDLFDDLDSLPYPNRNYFNSKCNVFGIIGSRGCTGKCTFCVTNAICGGSLRVRSIDNILDEARLLIERHNCKYIIFYDSTFCCDKNAIKSRLTDLHSGILSRNIKFSFSINMRTNQINEDNMDIILKLNEIGLDTIMLGFEAGNADDLAFYKKPCSIQDHNNALDILKSYGILSNNYIININIGFINFHPFSTIENIAKNIVFLKDSGLHFNFNIVTTRYENYGLGEISEKIRLDGLLLSDENLPIFNPYGYKFINEDVKNIYTIFLYARDKVNQLGIIYSDEWITTYRRWAYHYTESDYIKSAFYEYLLLCNDLNEFTSSLALYLISLVNKIDIAEMEKICDDKVMRFEEKVRTALSNSKKIYVRLLRDLNKINELVVK